ncbi:hypothetical protein OSTOST_13581 [Ostertagia ostertagi]
MELTDTSDDIDQLDVETAEDQRKSFQPQKNIEDIEHPDEEDDDEVPSHEIHTGDDSVAKNDDKPEPENSRQFDGLSALQSQLSQPNLKFHEMFETQRKLYNNIIEQQKKFFPPPPPHQQASVEIAPEKARARDFTQLAQTLKNEIIDSLSGSIDKVLKEWAANEMARLQQEAARPAMPPCSTRCSRRQIRWRHILASIRTVSSVI